MKVNIGKVNYVDNNFALIEKMLMEGNNRFIKNKSKGDKYLMQLRLELYLNGQSPKAVIITCSDSRVVPEFIFDAKLGELFVIRNAGNIIDENVIGNVEFAVGHLDVRYILIMAHEKCGAAAEAIEKFKANEKIHGFIKPIGEILEKINLENKKLTIDDLASMVEEENAKEGIKKLLCSEILSKLYKEEKIKISAAKYFLKTGEVKILQSSSTWPSR